MPSEKTELSFAFSVPIGAYHPLLRDCLSSLAIQNPRPQIAFLDASGDPRVAALLDEFADLATYRRSGPDKGQSDAIIEGWANIEGDILGWLNADDALYPGALAEASDHYALSPDTDVFYGHSIIIDDDQNIKGYHWAVEPPSDRILSAGIISQPSCFFRRRKLEEIGGLDRELHYTMDWDLWVRYWRAGSKFSFTDKVMSRVLWSRDAKTGGYESERRRELERIIGANNSFVRKTKSRIGFALHHVLEYLAPTMISDAIRARTRGGDQSIHGLDRTGAIRERAMVPLVHYDDERKRQITINLKGDSPCVRLSVGGTQLKIEGAGEHTLTFDEPALPGEMLPVTIENLGATRTVLSALRWA